MNHHLERPRTALEAVLQYLVLRQLAGKSKVVEVVYMYFVEGASPSTIARELGLRKQQVRGYVQRIVERAGNVARARAIVRYTIEYVKRIKPIITPISDEVGVCSVCNDWVYLIIAEEHVARYHPRIVNEHVYSIIDRVEKDLRTKELVGDRA